MQIYVCVKHVPDSGALIELDGEQAFLETNVKFIPSPFDEYGIEEALTLKEQGEVIIVCAGNAGAISSIRAALAMGADRAIHIVSQGSFTTSAKMAEAIAKAILQDGTPDLIFTGKQSIDSEGSQFPYFLAKELSMPIINDVSGLEVKDGEVIASREMGGGVRQRIRAARPCVLGVTRGLNEPRYPKLPDIMKSKKKPVQEIPVESLNLAEKCTPVLEKMELLPERASAKMFSGDVNAQVQELLRVLREEERVL